MDASFFDNSNSVDHGTQGAVESGDDYTGDYDLETFREWYKIDSDHSHKWRQEARECYGFVAGQQWSQEDAAFLKLSLRPIVTFNRIAPVIDSVGGLEVNNRQQVSFFPRHIGDAGVDDLLTGAAKWVRDECNAEDEESDSFLDLVTCGMGWTETKVTYDDDLDGKCVVERIDPIQMFWEAAAVKKNAADARRVMRVKDIPMTTAEEMFPEADYDDLHAKWAADTESESMEPHNAEEAPFYRNDQSGEINRQKAKVRIVEVQWWEHVTVWRMIDPFTGQEIQLSTKEYRTMIDRMRQLMIPPPKAVKQKKKQYWKAFLGAKVLATMKGAEEGGFTLKCMTGKRDRNEGIWYGMVRAMIDPQKWANKWLSQTMHILNSNAKGGIMAEPGAFVNPQEAEDSWAQSDVITWLKNGGATKVVPKPVNQMPSSMENLMQFAISSIRDVSGVNLELLGQADRDQPGILEHQRKQAAMTILAALFDSLRRYRKEQGRLLMYYITKYLSDGRLIKIGGQDDAQYVPLLKQSDTLKYDVIVDDTPNSVNIKEQTWAALQPMMPFVERMPMSAQLAILKYTTLPAALVTEITQAVQSAPPPQDPKAQMMQQKMQMDQQLAQAKMQNDQQAAQADHQADLQRIQAQAQSDNAQMTMEGQLRMKEMSMKAQTDAKEQQDKENARRNEMLLNYMLKDRELHMKAQTDNVQNTMDAHQFVHDNRRADAELALKSKQQENSDGKA